jgi:hypothetical protein
MSRTVQLTDIPPASLQQVISDFKADGATTVTPTLQPNGNYTVTATYD